VDLSDETQAERQLGEPATLHPEAALEEVFHLLGLVLTVGLVCLGVWTAVVNLRVPARHTTRSHCELPRTAPTQCISE
jgi:hypothetical protein